MLRLAGGPGNPGDVVATCWQRGGALVGVVNAVFVSVAVVCCDIWPGCPTMLLGWDSDASDVSAFPATARYDIKVAHAATVVMQAVAAVIIKI